jgi:outer membrane protein
MGNPSSQPAGLSSDAERPPSAVQAHGLAALYPPRPSVLTSSSTRRALGVVLVTPTLLVAAAAGAQTPSPPPQTTPTLGAPAPPVASLPAPPPPTGRVLHLDEAVEESLKQSPTLLSAQATVLSAQGVAEQTRSGLLPQLSASAVGERAYGSTGARTGSNSGVSGTASNTLTSRSGASNSFTFGLNGTQLIWDFQTVDRFRASNASVSSLQATAQATVINTVLTVRKAFFQAWAFRALIQVQEETLDNQVKHQVQTEGFVKVGTQPQIALAQARTNVANARVALIQAQNNYRIAKAQLNQSMGVVQGVDYDVTNEELSPLTGEDQPVDALTDIALHERPEVAAQLSNRDAQDLSLRAARGMYAPAFSLFAGVAETGPSLDALGPAWDFGLQVTWNFFDGLKTPGVVKQAQGNLDNANAQLTAEELQVRFDVEQADATLQGSKTALVAAEEALVNAREQLRLAEARYQTGVGSIIELSDAQVAATNAGAQLVQARFTLAAARAQLLAALGRQ